MIEPPEFPPIKSSNSRSNRKRKIQLYVVVKGVINDIENTERYFYGNYQKFVNFFHWVFSIKNISVVNGDIDESVFNGKFSFMLLDYYTKGETPNIGDVVTLRFLKHKATTCEHKLAPKVELLDIKRKN